MTAHCASETERKHGLNAKRLNQEGRMSLLIPRLPPLLKRGEKESFKVK
jgi:hypothetical protein